PVKRIELTPIKNDDPLLNFSLKENVIYTPTNEKCEITQIDYFYRQIELKFSDGSHKVTDEKSIRKYGDDTEPMKNKNISNKERLKILLDEKLDTYIRKNADYGNSFEEQFKEYGLLSL